MTRDCTKCQEPVRGGAKPHYLLPGVLVVSVHGRKGTTSETRHYCAACTPVVKDVLMELGFSFLPEDTDGPMVISLNGVVTGALPRGNLGPIFSSDERDPESVQTEWEDP